MSISVTTSKWFMGAASAALPSLQDSAAMRALGLRSFRFAGEVEGIIMHATIVF
jgi:hypothetical protein